MAKPVVSPSTLSAISTAKAKAASPGTATRKEASPRSGAPEVQSIRPARTAIAHAMGGNKGK